MMTIKNKNKLIQQLTEIYGDEYYNLQAHIDDIEHEYMVTNNGLPEGSHDYEVRDRLGKVHLITYDYKEEYTTDEDGDIIDYNLTINF